MPIMTWDARLPQQVMVPGYEESPATNVVRSQPGRGPAISRPRTSSNSSPLKCSVILHHWQTQVLMDFHRVTLAKGLWPFRFPQPRLHNQPLLDDNLDPILAESGDQILIGAMIIVMMPTVPKLVPMTPVTWTAALDLEVMP
jgi:hypothetical protein